MFSLARIVILCGCFASTQQGAKPAEADKGEEASEPTWATLVGSTERNKYHRLECNVARKIRPENAIWFRDANDATENGYIPAACKDRKCQPPLPDSAMKVGQLGGPGLPKPSLNPPEVPTTTSSSNRPRNRTNQFRAKSNSAHTARARVPPPRMTPAQEADAIQAWQGVPLQREYEARWRWDVWANWALDRWCERWHVTPSGRINTDTAYADDMEQLLLAKLKEMKEQIDDNRRRIKELKAVMEGKKKGTGKSNSPNSPNGAESDLTH